MVLGCILLLLSACAGHAQVRFYRGDTLPVSSGMRAWFLDTIHNQLYMDTLPYWQRVPVSGIRKVEVLGECLVVHTSAGYEVWRSARGPRYIFTQYHADGNGFVAYQDEKQGNRILAGPDLDRITYSFQNWSACELKVQAQSIAGSVGYCLPYDPNLVAFSCNEWRSWGLIGPGGQWLIPPQYDGPFRFKNGFATVQAYGQRLTINEKGTRVE